MPGEHSIPTGQAQASGLIVYVVPWTTEGKSLHLLFEQSCSVWTQEDSQVYTRRVPDCTTVTTKLNVFRISCLICGILLWLCYVICYSGDMAQQLRALIALQEVLSSIPIDYMVTQNHL